jgi:hypothetical protein
MFNTRSSIKQFVSLAFLPALILLSACGGGGSSEEPPVVDTPVTQPPVTPPPVVPVNTAPELSISSPGSFGGFDDSTAVTFAATATDVEDGNLSNFINWTSNLDGDLGVGANISVTLSAGNHVIVASVIDSGSLTDEDTVAVNVSEASDENTAPSVSITSPSNNSEFNEGAMIAFTANANDLEDGDLGTQIAWSSSRDGNLGTGENISLSLSIGVHSITASVTDSAQASNQAAITVEITEPAAENTAPVINITSPENNSSGVEGNDVSLTATANDAEDGSLNASIQWRSDIDGQLGTGASISVQLSRGDHVITAQVSDSETLTTESSVNYSVGAAMGSATVNWTPPSENTDSSTITDLAGFTVYYGESAGSLTESVVINNPETTSLAIDNLTVNTTYYFAVTALNSLGVESEFSAVASKFIN